MADAPLALGALIDQAAALLATDPARAEALARQAMGSAPNDPRVRLIVGSARRRLGDAAGARAILEPLAQAFPRAANTQYELGAAWAALGAAPSAIAALRRAVALNRELPEAWRLLGELLFQAGEVEASEQAFAEHERAAVRDPALKPAADAVFRGDFAAAEAALRRHIQTRPDDAEALRLLAGVFARQERFGDAEILLGHALTIDPGHDGLRFSLAEALFRQQKALPAIGQLEPLLAKAPKDAAYRNLLAACLGLLGEDERVSAIYAELLADFPKTPKVWLNYGHVLRALGRRDEAVAAYRRTLDLAPGLGDAYWSLANLKTAALGPEDEAALRAQLARNDLSTEDRLHLNYALGKAAEDRGDPAVAFAAYAEGARLRRTLTPYDADKISAQTHRSETLFTKAFFAERAGSGSSSDAPIFILGLPRSGSTLIEQILASHSQVEGTMELPYIGLAAESIDPSRREAVKNPYPDNVASLDAGALTAMGDAFIAVAQVHRKLGRPFFIDKMPNNFHYIGLIQAILPKAKIIDARRHPMASCFSAFKQHFAQGQAFSYDLTDLGRYYRDYVELMAHFDAVLPGRVHRVIYEDMVEDTEAQVRRLLDYCGLPFEEACLRFHENARTVRTVSSEQVRRPIFRDGLEQWRNYEAWLGPLKVALGPALENWRG
jgi:tetratricopeptide (TPR) repeat protein